MNLRKMLFSEKQKKEKEIDVTNIPLYVENLLTEFYQCHDEQRKEEIREELESITGKVPNFLAMHSFSEHGIKK